MSISKQLKKLQALSAAERKILLPSLLLLPVIALSLKLKGFNMTQAFLSKHIPAKRKSFLPENEELEIAQSTTRMLSIAAHNGPYKASCLERSLAAWWLLQRKGIHTELKIGVNKKAKSFAAHAWLEYPGNALAEKADIEDCFSAFDSRESLLSVKSNH